MSLNGALLIGKSGLTASQAALQVAGNNMANAATPGYHRQVATLTPARPEQIGRGQFVGQGVLIKQISRAVDTALQARVRAALGDEHKSAIDLRFLAAIETLQNELSENDLSSELSVFFNSFSELANNPEDNAVRSVVIQQGLSVAERITSLRGEYTDVRKEIDRSLESAVESVDGILDQIALLNKQISQTEQGLGEASSLRDQRDVLLDELSTFMDVSVVEHPSGSMDVLVGSIPVVLGDQSRGLDLRVESNGDDVLVSVRVEADQSTLTVRTGQIGALLDQRASTVDPAIQSIDDFAAQLIFQVNRLHSQGQGRVGYASLTGATQLESTTLDLNDPASGVHFPVRNGSFQIHVTNDQTGIRQTFQVNVNGDTDSLADLVANINTSLGSAGTAGISVNRALTLSAAAGSTLTFSDDSSGALAALGVNTFFSGHNAATIDVKQEIQDSPDLLAATAGHVAGSNTTAKAIADLQDVELTELGGRSLRGFWQSQVNDLAVRTSAASNAVESSRIVRESLQAQAAAVGGVSLDEEAINLMSSQRQFQAAARFITVIDETLQTLLSMV